MVNQRNLKLQLPNLQGKQQDLTSFNHITSAMERGEFKKEFIKIQGMGRKEIFSKGLIQYLFGSINRREDLEQTVGILAYDPFSIPLSARYLISFILDMSDIDLRSRILHYLTECYAVPLIYPDQIAFQDYSAQVRWVPEVLFNMSEGFGVLSLGVGKRAYLACGKTKFLNDMVLPDARTKHKPFIEDDITAFSSGHVDVFFDKKLKTQDKDAYGLVVMDVQGKASPKTVQKCYKLSNIVIMHVSRLDLEDIASLRDIYRKAKEIKKNYKYMKLILLIRDTQKSLVIKDRNGQVKNDSSVPNRLTYQFKDDKERPPNSKQSLLELKEIDMIL